MKAFKAIAAMTPDRVIGAGNQIPWHIPEDFKWFKKTTMGHTLVMGHRTFDSIGRPLPGRVTCVLSRSSPTIEGVHVIRSLAELEQMPLPGDIFICGGEQIYRLALPFCSDLYLTLVKRKVSGDAHFPPFEAEFTLKEMIQENELFTIQHYVRTTKPGGL
jgi:dihydrofolate reductase